MSANSNPPRLVLFSGLVAGLLGCGVDASDSPPHLISAPDLSAEDARAIAAGFVRRQAEVGGRFEWRDAAVGKLVTYYDSYNEIQAYEVAIAGSRGEPAGWIIVEAWAVHPPVAAYVTAGGTNHDRLLEQARLQRGEAPAADALLIPLWAGPASAALEIREGDGSIDRIVPTPELRGQVYDGAARRRVVEELPADPADAVSRHERYAHLRAQYRLGNIDDSMRGVRRMIPSVQTSGTVGVGAAEFSHYNQEARDWTYPETEDSDCASGCTPVAFTILTDYWDRHGFPSLVADVHDNHNPLHTDEPVRWTVDQFRRRMFTTCRPDGSGDTSFLNFEGAGYHFNARAAGRWTVTNTATDAWDWIKDEIDAERPAIVHYDADRTGWFPPFLNHSAVAYEYTDNPGIFDDWICAEKGWGWFVPPSGNTSITWDCFPVYTAGWVQATRVIPPSLPAPTGTLASDAQLTDRVRITWQAAPGATSYTIHRTVLPHPSVWPETAERRVVTSGVTATSFDDTSAVLGMTYHYWVAAHRGSEISAFSHYDLGSRAAATAAARVEVAGIQVVLGQYVCAAGRDLPARRATVVSAGVYAIDVPAALLPGHVDVVFYAASSPSCVGGWIRDYWPATVTYRMNGANIDRCVPRPDNADWDFVRGTLAADGTVTSSGTRACPGGAAMPATSTRRVRIAGVSIAGGEYVCAAGEGHPARRAAAVGANAYEASFAVALPTNLDMIVYLSSWSDCNGGWLRDLWPGAVSYSVDGTPVTRCVPRPDHPDWRYVRAAIGSTGAVTDAGTLPCPGASVIWAPIAVNATYTASISAAAEQRYAFPRQSGRTYAVSLHPTAGDPDLFTSKFSSMTRSDAQCSSLNGAGLDDVCTFTAADSGPNYVIVYGYSAAEYTLRVAEL